MVMIGHIGLLIAFVMTAAGALLLLVSTILHNKGHESAELVSFIGRAGAIVTFVALTVCCLDLVICFMGGDNSIKYVVEERSNSTSDLAWLYKLSGLWAGRQGSLLFWAWLISAFNLYFVLRYDEKKEALDDLALCISQLVLVAFLGVLFFSESNMPFTPLDASFFDANGELITGTMLGMNPLLEHWAMAVHPPTLFIGYAGLTLPFAYALAAMILGDDSVKWVNRVNGVASFSWLFLGIGIGLGSVWAYVVLGWGGYWGWDPVENASLLSWLACVALMHSFTLYRTHGTFKRWSVVCACFAFMFVIVGTFISRSGIVQSVHAFAGDNVSLVLFVALIVVALVAAVFGMFGRRKSFGAKTRHDEDSSFFSKEMGYFLNNLIMMVGAFVLAYMTIASALPSWMPLGGQSLTSGTYNAIARPLGIVVLLIVAVGPLLGWKHSGGAQFWKRAKVPGICAAVVFVLLMVYFFTNLLPAYETTIAQGGTAADDLLASGPAWYYNGLAIVGFAVASLLIFNSLYLLIRSVHATFANGKPAASADGAKAQQLEKAAAKHFEGTATLADLGKLAQDAPAKQAALTQDKDSAGGFMRFRRHASAIGGMFSHAALGIILIGLIGSSMYVSEHAGYLASSSDSEAAQTIQLKDYEVSAQDAYGKQIDKTNLYYTLELNAKKDGKDLGVMKPGIQVNAMTQQTKYEAAVQSTPLEDLFIVYRGVNENDDYSVDVRVNPLISFVWTGFILFVIGTAASTLAIRPSRKDADD